MSIIAVVGLFVAYIYLSGRISKLEEQIRILQGGKSIQFTPQQQTEHAPTPQFTPRVDTVAAPQAEAASVRMSQEQTYKQPQPSSFMLWIKEDFFLKLGALLLLIAFGWFVSYAFMNNWIGPVGRITLGIVAGIAFMGLGVWRIKTREHQGAIFTVLGSTVVLLTVFAARGIYEFFTPLSAIMIMFASVAFVAFVAIQYRRGVLAVASLVLGAVAPLLTNTDPNALALFSYLLVLVLGSLWVMHLIGTVALPVTAFMIVALYGIPYMNMSSTDSDASVALMFAFVFTVIFFVSSILSMLKRTDSSARQMHLLLALGTGIYIASWIGIAVEPVWRSLMDVMWALVFASGAFVIFMHTRDRVPFYIYGSVSIGLIGIATAAELQGPALTIAYAFEITALVFAAKMFEDWKILNRISFLYAIPILLSFEHIVSLSWYDGFLHLDFFALATLMVCLWMTAAAVIMFRPSDKGEGSDVATVLAVVGGIYATILVWLTTHSIMTEDAATTVSLFIYTVSGIAMHLIGKSIDKKTVAVCGNILVGLVVARLLLIDVWEMNIVGKITTFFVIGTLLISTAFITKTKKQDDKGIQQ